jgi:hypothetical protein
LAAVDAQVRGVLATDAQHKALTADREAIVLVGRTANAPDVDVLHALSGGDALDDLLYSIHMLGDVIIIKPG